MVKPTRLTVEETEAAQGGEGTTGSVTEPGPAGHPFRPGHPPSGSPKPSLPWQIPRRHLWKPWAPAQAEWQSWGGLQLILPPGHVGGTLLTPRPPCRMVTWAGTHRRRARGIWGGPPSGLEGFFFFLSTPEGRAPWISWLWCLSLH